MVLPNVVSPYVILLLCAAAGTPASLNAERGSAVQHNAAEKTCPQPTATQDIRGGLPTPATGSGPSETGGECDVIDLRFFENCALVSVDIQEVGVSQALLRQSRKVFLVADHSKFRRTAPARIASISEVDAVFTDQPLPKTLEDRCREWGLRVIVAR